MNQRIENTFATLKEKNKKALVTFIMGGDPYPFTSQNLLNALPPAGADIIEIGMPFSDPMADGAIIEAAGLRSLANGTKLTTIIQMVTSFRVSNATTPIILMGYFNPVYNYGIEKFCIDAQKAGVDGVILVDMPPEEEAEFAVIAELYGIKLIRLVTPTTDDTRFAMLTKNAGGFIYYVSVAGITGTQSADIVDLKTRVQHLKSKTSLPIAVGFGIKTPSQAAGIAAFSDAVVVGSALVECAAKQGLQAAVAFVASLRVAMDATI